MEDALNSFYKRQQRVQKKHARMAQGYKTKLDKNGVFVQVPDSKTGSYGLRIMMWSALVFMAFKAFLLTGLGTADYEGHVAALAQGTSFEQVGAWFMQIDPVTAKISELAGLVIG